ncbi:MAG: hypothetical protein ABGY24_15640 [bacterium]
MSRPVRSSRKQVDYALGDGGEEPAAVGNGGYVCFLRFEFP